MIGEKEKKLIQSFLDEDDKLTRSRIAYVLHTTHEIRIKDLSEILGLKPSYLCHLLRLHKLPDIVTDGYYSKVVTLSHLFIISRLKEKKAIVNAYESILAASLTIAQTEQLVRDILYHVKTEGNYLSDKEKQNAVQIISGTDQSVQTTIVQTRIKSKLIVEIKGTLAETTKKLKKLIDGLERWQER